MRIRAPVLDQAEREQLRHYSLRVPAGTESGAPAVSELRGYLRELERSGRAPQWAIAAHIRLRYGGACVEAAVRDILREVGESSKRPGRRQGGQRSSVAGES